MFFQNSLILHFLYFVLDDLNSPLIGVLLGIKLWPFFVIIIHHVIQLVFRVFSNSLLNLLRQVKLSGQRTKCQSRLKCI